MPLYLVPTPIGHPDDITLRGLNVLKLADTIVVEEFKESTRPLRHHGIKGKVLESLNEHSTPDDYERVTQLCQQQNVAFITDCGTPGFCDPGAELVRRCRAQKIPIHALPGPSSLMTAISLSGQYLEQFYFRGFLSAETSLRQQQWKALFPLKQSTVLMDTPYRLKKTLTEVELYAPKNKILLSLNLTQANEWVFEGSASQALKQLPYEKAEFILILHP